MANLSFLLFPGLLGFMHSTDNPLNISAPSDEDTDDILTIKVDSVPDGGVITTASGEVVSAGTTLTIEQLTGLVFTPNADANSDLETIGQFTYTVSDQDGDSDSSTVTITVTATQDPPTIDSATTASIEENTTTIPLCSVQCIPCCSHDDEEDQATYSGWNPAVGI